jgi:uncharacterized membrane protein
MMDFLTLRMKGKIMAKSWGLMSVICLSAVSFFFSVIIYLQHLGNGVVNGICNSLNILNQCDIVGASVYARILGFDNAFVGMAGFALLIFLSIYQYYRPNELYRRLIIAGSIIAGISAIAFICIQAFMLHAYCIYCLVVDAASILLLAIACSHLFIAKSSLRNKA